MKPIDDTYRHKGLRKKLVGTIWSKGITDERVLDTIGNIPRHLEGLSDFKQQLINKIEVFIKV